MSIFSSMEIGKAGMVASSVSGLYQAAWAYREDFEDLLREYRPIELHLKNSYGEPDGHMWSYIAHETKDLSSRISRTYITAKLYACMTVEGFTNDYGTRSLGEKDYKRLLERVGITEKISLLFMICFSTELDPKSRLMAGIRRIFDDRNSLVHPKTREFSMDDTERFRRPQPTELELGSTFDVMEEVIQLFYQKDNSELLSFKLAKKPKTENKSEQATPRKPSDLL